MMKTSSDQHICGTCRQINVEALHRKPHSPICGHSLVLEVAPSEVDMNMNFLCEELSNSTHHLLYSLS